jgi:hypothetical protein
MISATIVFILLTLVFITNESLSPIPVDWDCIKIESYMLDGVSFGHTPHNELTEKQHIALHVLYSDKCIDSMVDYTTDLSDSQWEEVLTDIQDQQLLKIIPNTDGGGGGSRTGGTP